MTFAAKLKASRQKQAAAAADPSAATTNNGAIVNNSPPTELIPTTASKQRSNKMPASIGHGSMENGRTPNGAVLDPSRQRNGGGHVQKLQPAIAPRRRSFHRLSIRMPTAGMRVVKDNYFVQALSHTTYAFCRETTLHGMKYVVQDIEELGSTFSR